MHTVPSSSVQPSRVCCAVTVVSRDPSYSPAPSSSALSATVLLPLEATTPNSRMLSSLSTCSSVLVSPESSTPVTTSQATLVSPRMTCSCNSINSVSSCHSSAPTRRRALRCVSHGSSHPAFSAPLSLPSSRDTLRVTTCTTCSSSPPTLVCPSFVPCGTSTPRMR